MTKTHRPWYTVLYIQVLIAIAAGVLLGNFWPDLGKALNPIFLLIASTTPPVAP